MKQKNESRVNLTIHELESKALELKIIDKPLTHDSKERLKNKISAILNGFVKPVSKVKTVAPREAYPSYLYIVWVRIDETLPWIELKRTYGTLKEAKEATNNFLNSMQIKIVKLPDRRSMEKREAIKVLTRIRKLNIDFR